MLLLRNCPTSDVKCHPRLTLFLDNDDDDEDDDDEEEPSSYTVRFSNRNKHVKNYDEAVIDARISDDELIEAFKSEKKKKPPEGDIYGPGPEHIIDLIVDHRLVQAQRTHPRLLIKYSFQAPNLEHSRAR